MKSILFSIIGFFIFVGAYAGNDCNLFPKFSYKTSGLTVRFINKTNTAYSNVVWNFGDGVISNKVVATHTFANEGEYTFSLTITNENGCVETKKAKVYVFNTPSTLSNTVAETPTLPLTPANNFTANITDVTNYPNPFSNATNISFVVKQSRHVNISIFDITGKLVSELVNSDMESGIQSVNFERNNLAAGTYMIVLSSNLTRVVKKISIL